MFLIMSSVDSTAPPIRLSPRLLSSFTSNSRMGSVKSLNLVVSPHVGYDGFVREGCVVKVFSFDNVHEQVCSLI